MSDDVVWTGHERSAEERRDFRSAVAAYLAVLRENYGSLTKAQLEDQLKAPVGELLKLAGSMGGNRVGYRTETRVDGVAGRPDLGFDLNALPVGNVELKAPGLGADPNRFKDKRSREQWERFKALPNLIYTDGEAWALFRSGDRVGPPLNLGASVTEGDEPAPDWAADALLGMLGSFFDWSPTVPSNAKALAQMLAPVTRLLRDEVIQDVQEHGILESLANEWRAALFPDATDREFADGYAQTFTYALLLARLEGAKDPLTAETAADELDADHALLGQTLRVLSQKAVREALSLPVSLMERLIGAVDAAKLSKGSDPWLYFYEDFLAEYDPAQRSDRGVFYTPVPIVGFQSRTVHSVLADRLGRPGGVGDESVTILDPAAGTGTYPLAIVSLAVDEAIEQSGAGVSAEIATRLAQNIYAFEILVGPYAVTHLRLSRAFSDAKATLPALGVNVFLTDTLAEPAVEGFAAQVNVFERKLAEEQERASRVKSPSTAITVVIGNPPYDRDSSGAEHDQRKGGMIRYETSHGDQPLIQTFLNPLPARTRGEQAMNLYNDYIYFWRWAIWKVCDQRDGAGIVSYITPNAFLAGAAFGGMREILRREFDEVWIVDLGGDAREARVDENVFNIQTPVCITTCVRYDKGEHDPNTPAAVRYRRIEGTREEKYAALDAESDLTPSALWRDAPTGWQETFVPAGTDAYAAWPLLSAVLPWSSRGMQYSRTWPIAETRGVLTQRWQALVDAAPAQRAALLHESRDSTVNATPRSLFSPDRLTRLDALDSNAEPDAYRRIGFRSFDRQWTLADYRLIDMPRPALWQSTSDDQVFMTYIDNGTTEGPALVANAHVPDMNSHNNRGGRLIPLYRTSGTSSPNINKALLALLREKVSPQISAEAVVAYVYGLTGTGAFARVFADHIREDRLRLPFTLDKILFERVARFGRQLIWWSTFGERCIALEGAPSMKTKLPKGVAQIAIPIQGPDDAYPDSYSYDPESQTLTVGAGTIAPLSAPAWEFAVSGYPVIESWLKYRMKARSGRGSTALDEVRPDRWNISNELLEVIAVAEQLVSAEGEAEELLHAVLATDLLTDAEVPAPLDAETVEPRRESGVAMFDL